jgi:hypothetical protein
MTSPEDLDSTSVVRTRSPGGLSGVTFHISPRARLSLPYNSLQIAMLGEGGEVVLTFKDYEIALYGTGLQQLPEDFILHKILRVQASARGEGITAPGASESIERIVPRRTGGEGSGPEQGQRAKRGR